MKYKCFCEKDFLDLTVEEIRNMRRNQERSIPRLVKVFVYKRDKGKCTNCGSKNKLHYHHIKRFSDGGQNTKDNLKLLCATCHAEEHKDEPSYYLLKSIAEG